MTLFVLINVPSQERILHLLQEIYRVLKPNAPFVILDTHPDSLGIRFLEHQRGEPNTRYQPGEAHPVHLFTGSTPALLVYNYYWPKETYRTLLATAGFSQLEVAEPTLKDLREEELATLETSSGSCQTLMEWDTPP